MKTTTINLKMAEKVKQFVNIVSRVPYDVDIKSGRFVVDAKSILGIFSLDLSRPLLIEIDSDDCDDLLEQLKQFE